MKATWSMSRFVGLQPEGNEGIKMVPVGTLNFFPSDKKSTRNLTRIINCWSVVICFMYKL